MATTWKKSFVFFVNADNCKERKTYMLDYLEYVKIHKNKMLGKETMKNILSAWNISEKQYEKSHVVAEAQKVLVQKNKKNQKDDLLMYPSVEDNAIDLICIDTICIYFA